MTSNFSQTAAFIWSIADLLRGDFKQSQYGRVILPFALLRRLECVLEPSKAAVLEQHAKVKGMPGITEESLEKMVLRATDQNFYNISPMDLSKLGEAGIKDNLENYIQSFSRDAREIFEFFKFEEFIGQLADANLLYKVVQKVSNTDLSPQALSNHEMGLVFEELIRRFAESSNETAGEHFTPRDIVRLTTSLVFMEDDDALTKEGIIRTIYDPTAGKRYIPSFNPTPYMLQW
ncbi:MAG: type I restriction-modification system subunit M N-terminal domain-containing protein [Motiliproteus sp.]